MNRNTRYKTATSLANGDEILRTIRSRTRVSDTTGCHEWQGTLNADGYGQASIEGRSWAVHRVVYELTYAKIPPMAECEDGKYFVLHKCDNPKCCNSEHLYLGNYKDNAQDIITRGRQGARVGGPSLRVSSPTAEKSALLNLRIDSDLKEAAIAAAAAEQCSITSLVEKALADYLQKMEQAHD